MKINKSKAYVYSLITLICLYILTLIVDASLINIVGPSTVGGIVGITLSFIGGNVADNGVKGAFYNEALNNSKEDK